MFRSFEISWESCWYLFFKMDKYPLWRLAPPGIQGHGKRQKYGSEFDIEALTDHLPNITPGSVYVHVHACACVHVCVSVCVCVKVCSFSFCGCVSKPKSGVYFNDHI